MIVYQDDQFFVIDKPAGFFVHPPEKSAYPTPDEKICLYILRKQLQRAVYPIHRLDAPTSGLVMFAYTQSSTRELSRLFAEKKIKKTYHAVVRGFLENQGSIELPLEIQGFEKQMESETQYRKLAEIELPYAVGKKYPTARYSLAEVQPITGRWHQIRRHFDRIAHPLIGDIEHGDSHHNRFFRDQLEIQGLCLRAQNLKFTHPWSQEDIEISAPVPEKWKKIYSLFQFEHS